MKTCLEILPLRLKDKNHYVLIGIDIETNKDVELAEIVFYTELSNTEEPKYSSRGIFNRFGIFKTTKHKKRVFIDLVFVDENIRGCGVGTRVINEFMDIMAKSGYEAVCLFAYPIQTLK